MPPSSTATPRPAARAAGVLALLALYYVMALTAAGQKSMTFDEMAHLTGGYTYWAFDDYRLHPENGNWPQRLGALPAVLSGAGFPPLNQPAWTTSNLYVIGDQYLYFSGNDADTLLSRARAVMALVGVALGALVYAWSRRLVSPAGRVAEPRPVRVQPHVPGARSARHVRHDRRAVLHRGSWRDLGGDAPGDSRARAWRVGARRRLRALEAFGTDPGAGRPHHAGGPGDRRPAAADRIPGHGRRVHGSRARQLAVLLGVLLVFALVAWALIWASYGFRYTAFSAATTGKDAFLGQVQDQPGIVGRVLSTARQHHLLPEAYIYASLLTVQFANERAAFLNGQFATTGWWWYFPYAFSVKTTIAAMLVGLLALAAVVVRWKDGREGGTGWTSRAGQSLRGHAAAGARRHLLAVRARQQPQHRPQASAADLPGALHPCGRRGVLDPAAVPAGTIGFIADWTRTTRTEGPGSSRRAELQLGRASPWCRDAGAAGVARGRVDVDQAVLPGVFQSARGRTLAGLPAPGRQLARLGTGPSRSEAVARR